ncbi:MAG: hypothetical protein DSZ01_00310 [Gammaproteobacteria bacterium]|nr:MAG: hypothetical protein DSZ02_09575 [Gammaproteobacteria bacterium]RTZ81744.1 MAG: hypothetical protein DSZ01_00310 [Gammaproteobacteria bacterium]
MLQARQAYVRELEPEQLARCILAASRELVLLAGQIPLQMLQRENREAFLARLKAPELREPVKLLARSHDLAGQAQWLHNAQEKAFWLRQAYHLLWTLDCFLVELASACRNGTARLPVTADPAVQVDTAGLH